MENNNKEDSVRKIPFTDEDGKDYIRVVTKKLIPRKTYFKGTISGKYRGSLLDYSDDYHNSLFFDFEIYEAVIHDAYVRTDLPFTDGEINRFPKEKLPKVLQATVVQFGKSFGINILEPNLYNFVSNRRFHQIEGDEAFGSFTGIITGYILDYEEIVTEEIIDAVEDKNTEANIKNPIKKDCISSGVQTGKVESRNGYTRQEFYCKYHNDRIWGAWKANSNFSKDGCFDNVSGCFVFILGGIFLIALLPNILYIIPFILIPIALSLFRPFVEWGVKILAFFVAVFFVVSLINVFSESYRSDSYQPSPKVESKREQKKEQIKVYDTINNIPVDTIIKRFRSWKDYNGKLYEGYYSYKLSSYKNASSFKRNINLPDKTITSYDRIIFSLKENDKNNLSGLYKLFDSIQSTEKLSTTKFAEMVVSFVQDIPYAIILTDACDKNLYNDNFIRKYLSSPGAICYGYQRYGINTPIEFLATQKGDCDTRTLLLYTIFSHYNYDVVLMSSEYYGHSILGMNLPYNGITYKYLNQRYILWETTSLNAEPGILPQEISNLNYWRISLKSK